MLKNMEGSASDSFIDMLRGKLINSQLVDSSPADLADIACLAVVDVRLCLEYAALVEGNRAMQTAADLVATHMRYAYSVPQHREYLRSGYSSEPLLAEVSSWLS